MSELNYSGAFLETPKDASTPASTHGLASSWNLIKLFKFPVNVALILSSRTLSNTECVRLILVENAICRADFSNQTPSRHGFSPVKALDKSFLGQTEK